MMKRILSILILALLFTNCNGNTSTDKDLEDNSNIAPYNVTDIGEGIKYNYDTLSTDYIKKVKTSLLSKNFKIILMRIFQVKNGLKKILVL